MPGKSSARVDFLDLPKNSRNRAIRLFAKIKAEMKQRYSLKELGLRQGTWDNIGLDDFVRLPRRHYLNIIDGKLATTSGKNVVRDINELYAFLGKNHVRIDRKGRRRSR